MNKPLNLIFALLLFPAVVTAQFRFLDYTDSAKLDQKSNGTQNVGPGVVVFDFNNDGWDDLYLPGGFHPDKLYLNMHDGTFLDVADTNFQKHDDYKVNSRAGTAFDYNNDGFPDVYICTQGNDILWKNNGDGTFTSVGHDVGLSYTLEQNQSNCATYGDIDGDGYNDFYVARWIDELNLVASTDPKIAGFAQKGFPNWFYINNRNGTFTEKGKEYGVDGDTGCSNIALFFDYDRDGDLDILVGNDFGVEIMPNRLWKNMLMETGQLAFTRVDSAIGMDQHLFCMTIAPNDYDRDGDFDFYETSVGPQRLMQNNNNIFTNVGSQANIPNGFLPPPNDTARTTTWTALFSDFDNDGWEDGFIVHGFIQTIPPYAASKVDTSEFIRNMGGVFQDYTDSVGVLITMRGKGGAMLDYNHDGKVDIIEGALGNGGGGIPSKDFRLYRNVTSDANSGHWMQINFTAKRTAKEGIGTTVDVWTDGICHSKQISTGGGQGSCNSLTASIGLGKYTVADSVNVFWPADKNLHRQIDHYYNVAANHMYHITENMTDHPDNNLLEGVRSEKVKYTLQLYPNPAANKLNIANIQTSPRSHFEIYDVLGVKQIDMTGGENILPLSIGNLRPGSYTLRITTNGTATTKQFIKE